MDNKMFDTIFNLKMTIKQLDRLSRKAEKDQKSEQAKVKKAIQQKNIEGARIYAENAIRKKNESLTYMRMSARIDAVVARIQTAAATKEITKSLQGVTKALDKAMKSMDLEKVSNVMEKFETQFEEMDVRTATVEGTMGAATTLSAPDDQVTALIKQVADENDLEITDKLTDLNPASASIRSEAAAEHGKEDQLARRLAALRQ